MDMLIKIFFLKQPYMEQAARDKARAEQEKTEYEVRTVDHSFSTILTVPFRIRTPFIALGVSVDLDLWLIVIEIS
jgi:hypothetical protein